MPPIRSLALALPLCAAAAWGQAPALEHFHDVLPALDFPAVTPAVALDFDLDGDVDVAGGPYDGDPARHKLLWLNDGDAAFAEAPGAFPPARQAILELVGADFDGDGLPEVFEARHDRGDGLFHNLGGGVFADVSSALPPGGQSTLGVVLD